MVNQVSVTDLHGQQYRVNGNEPILLDDPQTVWLIQSGSVALFAVTVKDGVIEGTRRYLFGSDSQEALFGTTPVEMASLVMAVPIGEVELLKVDRECFGQLVIEGDPRIVTWIEGWLEQID
ncbi:MAG: NHLP bacteriocin export ABC transporter permease/ATPase subunit, partial [Nostoc sp.]